MSVAKIVNTESFTEFIKKPEPKIRRHVPTVSVPISRDRLAACHVMSPNVIFGHASEYPLLGVLKDLLSEYVSEEVHHGEDSPKPVEEASDVLVRRNGKLVACRDARGFDLIAAAGQIYACSADVYLRTPSLAVVHFSAEWAEQCIQVTEVLQELLKLPEIKSSGSKFGVCDAETLSEISLQYKIDSVPTVVLFKNGSQVDRVDGADAAQISSKIKILSLGKSAPIQASPMKLEDRLKALINKHNVMVFMKGDRNTPRCGFSRTLIQILNETGVQYETFDILTDEEVRQGLKEYSDWPTYPQLYVKGELIGGLDIIKELVASGELDATLKA